MKATVIKTAVLTFVGLILLGGHLYAQNPLEGLGHRLVNNTLMIQPGEAVVITGDAEQIPLMEDISVEVIKKGGYPYLVIRTEKVEQSLRRDVPEQHLQLHHQALTRFKADAAILLSSKIDF